MAPNTNFTKNEAIAHDATFDASSIRGKSVVITGAASGIGEQLLRSFVKAGAFVTFGDVATTRGGKLAAEVGANHVEFVGCDVLYWHDQVRLFKTALTRSPAKTIDIVIANAGISGQDEVFNQDEDYSPILGGEPVEPKLNILKTNLVAVFYTIKLALFYLPKQPAGEYRDRAIIMTGSLASYLDHIGAPQYNAAKLGIRGIMKSIRQTGPEQNIRINMIAPWVIESRMMSDQTKSRLRDAGIEFAKLEDAGSAVLHLASDKSINGRAFAIVPRSMNPRGYYDLQRDDWNEDDFMTELQNISGGTRIRAEK